MAVNEPIDPPVRLAISQWPDDAPRGEVSTFCAEYGISRKQPLASALAELQAQVDAFDDMYNTERPDQGLPGRVTPRTAWEAIPKADPPRPRPDRRFFQRSSHRAGLRPPSSPPAPPSRP